MADEQELIDIIEDPKRLAFFKKKAGAEIAQIITDCFETEPGKKAFNILTQRFYTQECFVGERPDPYLAAKIDGQRGVLQYIYNCIGETKNG